jgi:hypothetical protein
MVYLIINSNTFILSGFTYLFTLGREICFMLYYVSRALLRFPVRPHPADRFRNAPHRVMLDSATFGAQLHFAHSSRNCKVLLSRFPSWLTCGERRCNLGRQEDTLGSASKEFSKNVLCEVWQDFVRRLDNLLVNLDDDRLDLNALFASKFGLKYAGLFRS